jgi:hypothetical protein
MTQGFAFLAARDRPPPGDLALGARVIGGTDGTRCGG